MVRSGQRVFAEVIERYLRRIDTLSAEYGVPAREIEDVLRAASRQAA